jgi:hypothetical protein
MVILYSPLLLLPFMPMILSMALVSTEELPWATKCCTGANAARANKNQTIDKKYSRFMAGILMRLQNCIAIYDHPDANQAKAPLFTLLSFL